MSTERLRAEDVLNKHDDRVQALSEKMASGPLEGLTKLWKDVYLNNARIAVSERAQGAADALRWEGRSEKTIQNYLTREGLIPDSTQEGAQNG